MQKKEVSGEKMSKFKQFILCSILTLSVSADALKCASEFNTASPAKKWMSFDQAQTFIQNQKIKTLAQFKEWKKAGNRPKDFPSNPNIIYKDKWRGWGDFLGTGNISVRNREWMSFHDAKALMQSQSIRTLAQFQEWSKSEQRPKDFPSNPQRTYKNEWTDWRDFLGTKWMSFDQAKTLMQSQGIRTREQFQEWSKSEQRPEDFPSHPERTYKDKWRGWGDFLGAGNISVRRKKEWMSFQDAKAHIQSQGIKTKREFHEWSKSEQRPKNFPSNPNQTYKNKWTGWRDFLGAGNISVRRKKEWMSFQDAKAHIQSQGIRTFAQFQEWSKSEQRPKDFPSNPNIIYKDKWTGWSNFLGTGNIAGGIKKEWMSFDQAQALMQSQGIKTSTEFNEWKKAGKRPKDFPSNPSQTYKNKWRGWGDFLGTGNISVRDREWMSFQDAKALIQSQGIRTREQFREWSKSGQRPENFPSSPNKVYTNKWRGWGDFLGAGNISTENSEQAIFEARATFLRQQISTDITPEEEKQASSKPENFSNSPDEAYKDEQTDPDNFLESETTWMSFNESKAFIQQLGITNQRDFFEEKKNNSDIFPENFPPNPKAFYTNTGEWIGWNDFLGLTNKSHSKINNSGENLQIEENDLRQEDIFTDAEEGSEWGEDVEI